MKDIALNVKMLAMLNFTEFFSINFKKQKSSWKLFGTGFFLIIFAFSLCGCGIKKESGTRFMMDTIVQIDIQGKNENKNKVALAETFAIMQNIAIRADRYSKSEVAEINKNAGIRPVKVSEDILFIAQYAVAQDVAEVDITLGPLIDLWNNCRNKKEVPTQQQIENAHALTGEKKMLVDNEKQTIFLANKGMSIDLGAIAKGYAVEKAGQYLAANENIVCALINGGGNIKVIGKKPDKKPWRIGIQDPRNASESIGILNLAAGDAVATSGDYHRYFELKGRRWHHILQPTTGWPGNYNISATAICKNAMEADYYSTLFFLLPAEESIKFAEKTSSLDAIIIDQKGNIYISSRLKEKFEKNEKSKWHYR